ncbi:hypothetical protein BGZ95_005512 [Linnemannia exigua]|uniref:Uncharacterized protein n=1 Tax=Linnemannia exigua TaxID=604196 RepID=A0AAD4H9S5_9FUNG|nr:hypothetical protein BGZ95_005512 [Linnemannia exigua]
MKFTLATAITLLATVCISTVTGQSPTPFIKTLARPSNLKNVPNPFHSYSRCEMAVNNKRPSLATVQKIAGPQFNCYQFNDKNSTFCTVKPEVRGMTTSHFTIVTGQLCEKYKGYLQIFLGP